MSEGVSIHWHGLYQRGTPWMDGPEMISQCPILPGQTFEYRYMYPTVTLCFKDEDINAHFDTGAEITLFSYEELFFWDI